ncbi:MAG: T9SS type A sorting domain-containing protein [Bacteroidota bacterium]
MKTSLILILFLIGLLFRTPILLSQNIEWARNVLTASPLDPRIASDKAGNSFVFGNFLDTCTFGTFTLISNGEDDIYITKYNPTGIVQWSKGIGGISTDRAQDVATDPTGNVYIMGGYQGPTDFGGIILSGSGSFVAKYSSLGNLLWAHPIDTLQGTYGMRITVSDSGTIFIAGNLLSQTDFGCAVLNKGIYDTQFILRYDSNGVCQWVQSFITPFAFDITTDKNNCVYLTGVVMGQGTFGTNTILSHGSQDIFIAKCNANGTWAWAHSIGSNDFDQGTGITADNYGHIYCTGYFKHTATFGSYTLTSQSDSDIFIACYDSAGNCLWAKKPGGGYGSHYAFEITSDRKGNCIVTGGIIDTTHFGNYTILPNGEKTFVAKYDSLGDCKWAIVSNGDSGDRGLDIKTDTLDNIFLTGLFFGAGNYEWGNNSFYIPYTQACTSSLNKCSSIFVVKINSSLVNVHELDGIMNNLKIYPNPTNSILNIIDNQNQFKNSVIEVKNYFGQVIFVTSFTNQINLSDLSDGLYFLTIQSTEKTITLKIIKQ